MKIKTCFAASYYAETRTASMRKLPVVAQLAEQQGFALLVDPGSIDPEKLRRLHNPFYVEAFLSGEGALARSQGWPWTPEIRDGVLAIQAGQIKAAEMALEEGIAANVAQGFHHARYERGSAYCTFNGLALVAQEFPDLKIGVLDCDEHQGNGTAEFTERLPNLYNFTIYGSSLFAIETERSVHRQLERVSGAFQRYLSVVEEGCEQLRAWEVDLVIYQAGADPHLDDPLNTLGLSTSQLYQRDRQVFRWLREAGIPAFFVLAGGYQEPISEKLAPLHVNTFRAASECYGRK